MQLKVLVAALALAGVGAVPLHKRAGPSVTLQSGTFVGSTASNVDTFNNIPFAQPPTGSLRLKPPQPLNSSVGTFDATGLRRSCPQFLINFNPNSLPEDTLALLLDTPLLEKVIEEGEDCLTVNVQRPSGTASNAGLPVFVWIYGGGFELGSPLMYDGTSLISAAVTLGEPIVFVAINYRVGGFGFLAGKELQADGSTNLGLRDQRLALEWVQDNIAAFGGDPTKVTVAGESAGSISVFDQTVINGGDISYKDGNLFRAAIMDSGSVVPADTVSGPSAQAIYDAVVQAAGCSTASDTLACLRTVSYTQLQNAMNSVPGILSYRSLDLSYLPRPDPNDNFFSVSPEVSVAAGNYAKVPIIIGDQQDEGTLFALFESNITTNAELISYLASYFPTNPSATELVTGLVANYPDDDGISGSPYNTGLLNNIYPEFKRLASILGDITFILTRRLYLSQVANHIPAAWSYLGTYFYGLPVLGTFHATDILYLFGILDGLPKQSIQTYYISFVTKLDPNALSTASPLIQWPKWNSDQFGNGTGTLLNFGQLDNSLLADNFREAAYEYLTANTAGFRV